MIDPIRLLRETLDGGNQAEMARKMGISPQYLNDVLNEKRGVGDKILEYLGLEKVVTYRRRKGNGT